MILNGHTIRLRFERKVTNYGGFFASSEIIIALRDNVPFLGIFSIKLIRY